MQFLTAGESHGQALIALTEGFPAGVEISADFINSELARRRGGIGRGERQKFEQDELTILSGVIQGKSIGSPIALQIRNSEWEKWKVLMSPTAVEDSALKLAEQPNMPSGEESDRLQKPRPGHADFEGMRKFGFSSSREVLERSSARETAARVANGALAKLLLEQVCSVEIAAVVVNFGGETNPDEFEKIAKNALSMGETVGGVVEVVARNMPFGLGSYTSSDSRLDSVLAARLMSIQAVKGVEIGLGFGYSSTPGSKAHDEISARGVRSQNNAGGIEGGISNGQPIVARIVIKPIPSVPGGLKTFNTSTLEDARGHSQRSDCSAVFPARVVAEAEVAMALASELVKKFGGDSVQEIRRNLKSFVESQPEGWV